MHETANIQSHGFVLLAFKLEISANWCDVRSCIDINMKGKNFHKFASSIY